MRMSSHKGAGKSPNGMIYIETADQGVSRNMVVPASATDSKSSLDLVLFYRAFWLLRYTGEAESPSLFSKISA